MEKKDVFTKILAILGTILIWFPVLAPLILAVGSLTRAGMFRFDYLMPAELFPSALLGGILLVWASMRARSYRKLIGWGVVIAVILLFGGQALAVVTGLASGETEPTTLLMALVLGPILIYALALAVVGVGGILLVRDLFKHPAQ
ncbi:MAG: hypothetical protein Q7T89_12610 [Anaerolineales bacterium]|nr:hypothetical protein [Anaerolineales bacterium]